MSANDRDTLLTGIAGVCATGNCDIGVAPTKDRFIECGQQHRLKGSWTQRRSGFFRMRHGTLSEGE
jgi:hypothetical protein